MIFKNSFDSIARAVPERGRRVFRTKQGWNTENAGEFVKDSAPLRERLKDARLPEIVFEKNSALPKEGCLIRIAGDDVPVRIAASTAAGAYYSLTTLLKLREKDGSLPCGEFEDFPALGFRGVHLTLGSGFMPTAARMKELIRKYSEFRINELVLEYDDRFPWKRHPELVHPNAWCREELSGVLRFAKEHFIEVIPLLDSLGHAEQYLKCPEHKNLAELPGKIAEMCPQNPDVSAFMEDLWDEVLEFHTESRYAHISGDEVFRMGGFCPKCAKAEKEGRLPEVYVAYYTRLSRFIIARGKIPVMWDDMLIKYPEIGEKLPKDILINNWTYTGYDADRWDFRVMTHSLPSKRKQFDSLFAKSFDQRPDGTCRPYPAVHFHRSNGFQVLGATAASHGLFPIAEQMSRIVNQRRMAQTILDNGGIGTLVTYWSDSSSVEGAMCPIAAAGDYSWKPYPKRDEEIVGRFERDDARLPENAPDPVFALKEIVDELYDGTGSAPEWPVEKPPETASMWAKLTDLTVRIGKLECTALELALRKLAMHVPESRTEIDLQDKTVNLANVFPPDIELFPLEKGVFGPPERKFHCDPARVATVSLKNPVLELSVNMKATEIEFLNLGYYISGAVCAQMEYLYTDGSSSEKIDLKGGRDLADWWSRRTFGKNVYPLLSRRIMHESPVQAVLTLVENPHPEKKIRSVKLTIGSSEKCAETHIAILGCAASVCGKSVQEAFKEEIGKLSLESSGLLDEMETLFATICPKGEYESRIERIRSRQFTFFEALR